MEEGRRPSMVAAAPGGWGAGGRGRAPAREERLRRGYQEMGPLNRRLAEEWVPGELEPRCWEWGGEGG
ncbi:MAG TPA: DEAD/DEAH box helicase [Thermaerobacter sp.]